MSLNPCPRTHSLLPAGLLLALLLSACSDKNYDPPLATRSEPLPIALPSVSAPPDEGQPALLSTTFELEAVGYEQQEFFISGSASAFTNINSLESDGHWLVEPGEAADYRTRVLVYRPRDPAAFSGTVFVEWLNVTTGFELPVTYGTAHNELLRQGHVVVMLSAQFVGVEGAENPPIPVQLYLKAVNPARYGSLNHPGDSFSYDMLTQLGGLLRDGEDQNLLDGMEVSYLFAMGQSGSASRLVTYYNAIQPLYQVFDGFLLQNRGSSSSPLAQSPQETVAPPDVVNLRTDSDAVAITVQGETDVVSLGANEARQQDNSRFRLWEVAGASHNDEYTFVSGRNDIGADPRYAMVVEQTSILGFQQCDLPMNSGYLAWPVSAAARALVRWVRDSEAPAEVARLVLADDGQSFVLDDAGNATGGLRTPYVDAPAAILSGLGQSTQTFCFLFGTTGLYDAAWMASRYTDKAGYVNAVSEAVAAGIALGTLLPEDGERIRQAAGLQWDSQVTGAP